MTNDEIVEWLKVLEKENRELILKQAKIEVENMKIKELVIELSKTIVKRHDTLVLMLKTIESITNRLTNLENSIIIPVNETKH